MVTRSNAMVVVVDVLVVDSHITLGRGTGG